MSENHASELQNYKYLQQSSKKKWTTNTEKEIIYEINLNMPL